LILGFEFKPIQAADEAPLFNIGLKLVAVVTHVRESIDYDTEDQVQQENYHKTEECEVEGISHPVCTCILIHRNLIESVSDSAASSKSVVECGREALQECTTV
jgi:hypothetical protein